METFDTKSYHQFCIYLPEKQGIKLGYCRTAPQKNFNLFLQCSYTQTALHYCIMPLWTLIDKGSASIIVTLQMFQWIIRRFIPYPLGLICNLYSNRLSHGNDGTIIFKRYFNCGGFTSDLASQTTEIQQLKKEITTLDLEKIITSAASNARCFNKTVIASTR